jgi:hypothetical protein
MKDLPIEELAAISAEIHEAAVRVGCTNVSITGQIWPGGQLSGSPERAARFVEFSWLRAAVINGRAIFEDADAKSFAALLNAYGIGDEPYPDPIVETSEPQEARTADAPAAPARLHFATELLPATKRELERQATAAGLSTGEFLDWKFRPPVGP